MDQSFPRCRRTLLPLHLMLQFLLRALTATGFSDASGSLSASDRTEALLGYFDRSRTPTTSCHNHSLFHPIKSNGGISG